MVSTTSSFTTVAPTAHGNGGKWQEQSKPHQLSRRDLLDRFFEQENNRWHSSTATLCWAEVTAMTSALQVRHDWCRCSEYCYVHTDQCGCRCSVRYCEGKSDRHALRALQAQAHCIPALVPVLREYSMNSAGSASTVSAGAMYRKRNVRRCCTVLLRQPKPCCATTGARARPPKTRSPTGSPMV